nr:hypothetical protein [Microctonus hyperodae filamentous virus]
MTKEWMIIVIIIVGILCIPIGICIYKNYSSKKTLEKFTTQLNLMDRGGRVNEDDDADDSISDREEESVESINNNNDDDDNKHFVARRHLLTNHLYGVTQMPKILNLKAINFKKLIIQFKRPHRQYQYTVKGYSQYDGKGAELFVVRINVSQMDKCGNIVVNGDIVYSTKEPERPVMFDKIYIIQSINPINNNAFTYYVIIGKHKYALTRESENVHQQLLSLYMDADSAAPQKATLTIK